MGGSSSADRLLTSAEAASAITAATIGPGVRDQHACRIGNALADGDAVVDEFDHGSSSRSTAGRGVAGTDALGGSDPARLAGGCEGQG